MHFTAGYTAVYCRYLGRCYADCPNDIPVDGNLFQCFRQSCTHAYALTRSSAQTLVNAAFPIRQPIDEFLKGFINSPEHHIDAYCAKPAIFNQDRMTHGSLRTERDSGLPDMPECLPLA